MSPRVVLALLGFILIFALPARGEKLTPFDNTQAAPGFSAFKQRLVTALQKRDVKYINSILSPNVDFSFGGQAGAAQFRKEFKPEDPRSPFWSELQKIVGLGGSYDAKRGTVWFPSLFDRWPERYDGLEYAVVVEKSVPLRSAADASADVVETLSYDIVKLLRDPRDNAKWMKVQAPDKKTGWVQTSQIHSPGWRRAAFKRISGKWMLTTYIAGD